MAYQWSGTVPVSELDKLRIESAFDQSLRNRLKKDAAAVFAERGIEVPAGVKVSVAEDTLDSHIVTLPPFVGTNINQSVQPAGAASTTTACVLCSLTSPICIGSVASLACAAAAANA